MHGDCGSENDDLGNQGLALSSTDGGVTTKRFGYLSNIDKGWRVINFLYGEP